MGDVTFSAGALTIITALITALVGTIGMLFRQLMASKDTTLKDVTSQRDSYQKIAAQSIAALELAANRQRRARGEQAFDTIPPVVPDHNSPSTQKQIDTAEYQTLLARATAAARHLGLPPISKLPSTPHGAPKPDEDEVDVEPGPLPLLGPIPDEAIGVGPPLEESNATDAVHVVPAGTHIVLKVGQVVSVTAEPADDADAAVDASGV